MTANFSCPLCGGLVVELEKGLWGKNFECVRNPQCSFFLGVDKNQSQGRIAMGNWINGKTFEEVMRQFKLLAFK